MKYLRRSHLFSHSEMEIRASFGQGDDAVYVMDDGRKHCLVSRRVGSGSEGSTYCLVAQIPVSSYELLVDGAAPEAIGEILPELRRIAALARGASHAG